MQTRREGEMIEKSSQFGKGRGLVDGDPTRVGEKAKPTRTGERKERSKIAMKEQRQRRAGNEHPRPHAREEMDSLWNSL